MGAVGLSFGSATSGQGINVSSTVAQIVSNLQAVETPWKTQRSTLQAQNTELSTLGTELSNLLSSLQSLTDFTGVLAGKLGSSSDENVLQLQSANSSAVPGPHTLVVTQLAANESYASNSVSSADDKLSGSLTIGSAVINLDGSETLSDLATMINREGLGVTANVFTGANGSTLSLVSNTSGTVGAVTVSGSLTDVDNGNASIGLSQSQAAHNAVFTVDGVTLTSSSNTVTNAIGGVTFQLVSANKDEAVQIQITNDTQTVENTVLSFVSNYNTVMEAIDGQEASGMPLFGNANLAQIQQQLESSMIFSSNSGSVKSLNDLGISLNNDGTLSVNFDTLGSAINSNYSGIISFFQDAGNFGSGLASTLNNLDNINPHGLIALAQKEIASQVSTINDKLTQEDAFISQQQATLTAELNQANQILQQIPVQLNMVNEIYSAFSGFNSNKG
jgi:flagellar hook-associated protein 2